MNIDNLLIDVSAEFAPIKLPLGEVKAISQGLVVELGHVVNNRVQLKIDNQRFAWGRLVIVGDQFGVVVESIESPSAPPPAVSLAQNAFASRPEVALPNEPAHMPEAEAEPALVESALDETTEDDFINDPQPSQEDDW